MLKWWTIEPLLQWWRLRAVLPQLEYGGVLVDIGCDVPPVLINRVKSKMIKCIGLDIVAKPAKTGNVEIKTADLQKRIPLPDKTATAVTMLAVLEHMHHPRDIVAEIHRILRPGGKAVITVPSPKGEPLLDWLAAIRLVRPDMIEQHQNYFTPEKLFTLFQQAGFSAVEVKTFEFGLNTLVTAVK